MPAYSVTLHLRDKQTKRQTDIFVVSVCRLTFCLLVS